MPQLIIHFHTDLRCFSFSLHLHLESSTFPISHSQVLTLYFLGYITWIYLLRCYSVTLCVLNLYTLHCVKDLVLFLSYFTQYQGLSIFLYIHLVHRFWLLLSISFYTPDVSLFCVPRVECLGLPLLL